MIKRILTFSYLILVQCMTLWIMTPTFILYFTIISHNADDGCVIPFSVSSLLIVIGLCVASVLFLFFNWLSWQNWYNTKYQSAFISSLINYAVFAFFIIALVPMSLFYCGK